MANVRLHGTTHERPRVRFVPPRRYTSLVRDETSPTTASTRRPRPVVEVEKRSLAAYAPRRRRRVKHAVPSRRDRLRHILADLRMPSALEALT
jgi:hypothetical protein